MSYGEYDDNRYGGRYPSSYGDADGKPTDMGNALKDKIGVSDDGKLNVFGHSFNVGPEFAPYISSLVTLGLNEVSLRGAATARKFGTAAAEIALTQRSQASKVGKVFYYAWLFGLSGADVALGIKTTVQNGFKGMHALREQAQPLLAANNGKDVSLGKALISKSTVLAHARARVYEKARRDFFGTLAGAIKILPNIAMGIRQHQMDALEPRQLLKEKLSGWEDYKNIPRKERTALRQRYMELKLQDPQAQAYASMLRRKEIEVDDLAKTKGKNASETKAARKRLENLSKKAEEGGKKARLEELREQRRDSKAGPPDDDPIRKVFRVFSSPKSRKRMFQPQLESAREYEQAINDLRLMPLVSGGLGKWIDSKISDKETPQTAWDKIMELQETVERHHENPDRDRVVVMVKDILAQHAQDLGRRYPLEGAGYDRTAEAIADAIARDKLHPQALAEILDNNKIVAFGKGSADFGDTEDVKGQLELLVAKYNSKVGEKEVYKNAPFTKESLVATFKEIPEEEKPFFTLLFPPGVLEKAGVPRKEVQKCRDAGKQHFVDALTDMTRAMIGMGREELKKQGVKAKQIDALEALDKQGFRSADRDGDGSEFVRNNMRDVTKAMRNIVASAKKPGEMWKEFLARKESSGREREDLTPKTPAEHAQRNSGDETHIG